MKKGERIADLTKEEVLEKLLLAHQAWFDIYRNHEFEGKTFPGYAEFHTHGEQYVLVKRAKLWEVDSHEYLFFQTVDTLDEAAVDGWVEFMCEHGFQKAKPQPNHMSSNIALVLIADSASDDAVKTVKKTRFRKNFKLGLEGWADLKLALVDLSGKRIVANGAGKDLIPTLEANVVPKKSGDAAGKKSGSKGNFFRRKS